MATRFLAQRLDCLLCLCLQTRLENGFVPVAIIFGYLRGFGTVRPARMEFLVGTGSRGDSKWQVWQDFGIPKSGLSLLESGGREGIRTPGLLVANEEKSKLRLGATIT